jgi:hypothetical protein
MDSDQKVHRCTDGFSPVIIFNNEIIGCKVRKHQDSLYSVISLQNK